MSLDTQLESGLDIWTREKGLALVRVNDLTDQGPDDFSAFGQEEALFRIFPENEHLAFAYNREDNSPLVDADGRHFSVSISPEKTSHLECFVRENMQPVSEDEKTKRIECDQIIRNFASSNETSLDISSKGLTSAPYGLHTLPHLDQLDLRNNKLTSNGLPEDIYNALLKNLFLQGNELTNVSALIGGMKNLEKLYLADNELTNEGIPEDIYNAPIKVLILSGNHLSSVSARIGGMKNLEKLYLVDNELTDDGIPEEVYNAPLKILSFVRNKLTRVSARIGGMKNLEFLYLGGNQLTDEGVPDAIYDAPLKMLNFRKNKLTKLSEKIGSMPNLETLSIVDNDVTDAGFPTEVPPKLRHMYVAGNYLTRLPEAFIRPGLQVEGMEEQRRPNPFPDMDLHASHVAWITHRDQAKLFESLKNEEMPKDQRIATFYKKWDAFKDRQLSLRRRDIDSRVHEEALKAEQIAKFNELFEPPVYTALANNETLQKEFFVRLSDDALGVAAYVPDVYSTSDFKVA